MLQTSLDPRAVCAVKGRAAVVGVGSGDQPLTHTTAGAQVAYSGCPVISLITRCPWQIWQVRKEETVGRIWAFVLG